MSAPAATANVSESWKLIPHSAWWAAIRVSGVAVAYGRICRSIPASPYQPSCRATKNPVWSVFGVQSRARRTVVGAPAKGVGEAATIGGDAGDGDDDPSGAAHGAEVGAGAAEPQAPDGAGVGV